MPETTYGEPKKSHTRTEFIVVMMIRSLGGCADLGGSQARSLRRGIQRRNARGTFQEAEEGWMPLDRWSAEGVRRPKSSLEGFKRARREPLADARDRKEADPPVLL